MGKKCVQCRGDIKNKAKSIPCNACKESICLTCLDIEEPVFNLLKSNATGSVLVMCESCKKFVPSLNDIKQTMAKNHEDTNIRFDNIGSQLVVLERSIGGAVKKEVKKQMKNHEDRIGRLEHGQKNNDDLVKIIEEKINENNEKMRRKNNLILYNVVESNHVDISARVMHDKSIIGDFFKEIDPEMERLTDCMLKVNRIGAIGNVKANPDGTRVPRPLKIVMDTPHNKFLVLNKYRNARRAKKEFAGKRSMCPDYTPAERAAYKLRLMTAQTSASDSEEDESVDGSDIVSPTQGTSSDSMTEGYVEEPQGAAARLPRDTRSSFRS